ncbi:Fur-regulated basic protein FbpA [Heyndrickxia acidiproducens]|uniref:Fur-regulated basic protein FbpA n=1 Tax=Heyndrickxia acidiproducens TaxID=1121084 RepID=UPI0003811109|nr:Fur-regulated basic protein FbpA [Heyndrickxia acidiproducens]
MGNLLREAIEKKRQFLMAQLIAMGTYPENDKQLSKLTLTELEKEYAYSKKKEQESRAAGDQ